jgi:hypothetical protein
MILLAPFYLPVPDTCVHVSMTDITARALNKTMEELVRTEPYWMETGISLFMKTMLMVRLVACQFRLTVSR